MLHIRHVTLRSGQAKSEADHQTYALECWREQNTTRPFVRALAISRPFLPSPSQAHCCPVAVPLFIAIIVTSPSSIMPGLPSGNFEIWGRRTSKRVHGAIAWTTWTVSLRNFVTTWKKRTQAAVHPLGHLVPVPPNSKPLHPPCNMINNRGSRSFFISFNLLIALTLIRVLYSHA